MAILRYITYGRGWALDRSANTFGTTESRQPPSLLLAVPNVTTRLVYQLHVIHYMEQMCVVVVEL